MVTEFYPQLPECVGRDLKDLVQDENLLKLKRFKDIVMDNVTEGWWSLCGDRDKRLKAFFSWIRSMPQSRIAVVCHWGFIYEMILNSENGEEWIHDNGKLFNFFCPIVCFYFAVILTKHWTETISQTNL